MRAVEALGVTNPVVVIDGRSGAGKTTLARLVADRWPIGGPVQMVALDSLYPGWDGLAEGAQRAYDGVLRAHARGLMGSWRRWDWERSAEAETHGVDPALGLILEGCGVLTPAAARVADVSVWVDGPAESRRRRALERDGDGFRPHWERWARQEDEHIRVHAPEASAQIRIEVP